MSNFIVCAYYTPNYKNDVERLIISLKAFGYEYIAREYERLPTWEQNTGIKPQFLLDCLGQNPGKDVLYLDADAFVRHELEGLKKFEGDIGIHFNLDGGRKASHTIRTGTIFLRNTDSTKSFLRAWIEAQKKNIKFMDQDSFEIAYKNYKDDIKFFNLPVEYVKIFDKDNIDPYVEHFQASRRDDNVKAQSKRRKKLYKYATLLFINVLLYIFFFVWLK
ncbi:MAG: hypothetical protein KAU29_11770 [Gammaproteobacteria bacterium]|nr:hypothetical protein [Gammaproteobacteria bacterium]